MLPAVLKAAIYNVYWLCMTRSASNPMEKGACNSANSKIQTRQPNANYSIFKYSLIRMLLRMLEYVVVDGQ